MRSSLEANLGFLKLFIWKAGVLEAESDLNALKYLSQGIIDPKLVEEAEAIYQRDADTVYTFLKTHLPAGTQDILKEKITKEGF